MRERKPFDPEVRRVLEEQAAAAGAPPPPEMGDEARVSARRAFMVRALRERMSIDGLPNGVETREVEVAPGLGARLYLPAARTGFEDASGGEGSRPVLVYLHGGGWTVGSVATVDPFCRLLSEAAGVIVLSVEYRLAPEHRYPVALEDTLLATRWAVRHAAAWGGDPRRIAIGGDSAGANLAAVTANRLGSGGEGSLLCAQLLLYPATDHPDAGHLSYQENATGYGLEANLMRWFWEQYAPDLQAGDASLFPSRLVPLPGLPPTLVATAEYDVLRDEGIAYAEQLRAAGTPVTHLHAPEMSHNFPVTPGLVARLPQCRKTLGEIAGWLRETLGVDGVEVGAG